ncbi:MAG: diguanylate cyclase [Candidatus Wallbacteria bacterium]|nr:diguanylate cyclase [Candidatus Wallbacteria bacterium]
MVEQMVATMVMVSERGAEQSFPLDGPKITVGREEGCNIVLPNAWVSRRHACLRANGDGWVLVDEGSTHFTYHNKNVLKERQEQKLTHGDHVCFGGKVNFVFLDHEDESALERVVDLLKPNQPPGAKDSYANFLAKQMDSVFSSLKDRGSDATLVEQLNDRVSRSVAELRCLYEVGNAINAETELDKVLELILTYIIPATGAERGFIMLLDAEGKDLRTVLARDRDQGLSSDELTTFSKSIARRALETGKTIVSKDTASDPDISSKSILDYQIRSAICAPLVARGDPLGTLYVDAKESLKEFGTKDVDFFTALANQSAIAVYNSQLMRELRDANRDLMRRVTELKALFEVSQRLNMGTDLKGVLETILDKSIEVLGAERGSIMLFDEGTDMLRVRLLRGDIPGAVAGAAPPAASGAIGLRRGEGIAGKVVETGQGIISNKGFADPLFKKMVAREKDIRQILCVPLRIQENVIGVINLINKKSNEDFESDDLRLLQSLASQAAVTIDNNRLYNLSIYDGLTGVFVHRHFQRELLKSFDTARRYGRDFSLLLIDIDHFKRFNDTYGHQVGDLVLAEVAALFKRTARTSDIVARYGGEEFAMILPETSIQGARAFAERLRALVEANIIQSRGGPLHVTISLGVSSLAQGQPSNKDDLIKQADAALYDAKRSGRNRVACAVTEDNEVATRSPDAP